MEHDNDSRTQSSTEDRRKEPFSVRLSVAGTAQNFDDPREAGAAFFRADPAERPTVTHVDGNSARPMARTELHGVHESGEPRYVKSLPDSHRPDAAFRAGFLEALEISLAERLAPSERGADTRDDTDRFEARLKEDLEAFARHDPERAAALWTGHREESAPGPVLRAAVIAREERANGVSLPRIPNPAEGTVNLSRGTVAQTSEAQTDRGRNPERPLEASADRPSFPDTVRDGRESSQAAPMPTLAISAWLEETGARIDQLPRESRTELRAELYGIASEAAAAFGEERTRAELGAAPRSTVYGAQLGATSLSLDKEEAALHPDARETLKAGLIAAASDTGIDPRTIARRLETGAANAQQEASWVRSDIAEVAARHRLDLGDDKARARAAEIVDRFYERAADLIHDARAADVSRETDPLVQALGALAKTHHSQGAVAFRNEDQARDFTEAMQERYGASVLKDMAAGRTEALAKDIPDASARAATAAAVIAAAKEHPALGLSAHEAQAAERQLAAQANARDRHPEHALDRAELHDREL